jgi:ParB family chromosome partitioning protein
VQIENGWRSARDRRPGAVQRGHFREIEPVEENPDAEPAPPCAAAKTAIIIYGNGVGTTPSVCTDDNCPIHDPRAAAADPVPTMEPAKEAESEEEAEERKARYQQQREQYGEEQERKAEARRQEVERQQEEYEAERARKEKLHKARLARFDRILSTSNTFANEIESMTPVVRVPLRVAAVDFQTVWKYGRFLQAQDLAQGGGIEDFRQL